MPAAIRVTPWPDPVLDVLGHDPRSWYAENLSGSRRARADLCFAPHAAPRRPVRARPRRRRAPRRRHGRRTRSRCPGREELAAHPQPRPAPPVRACVCRERDDDLGAHVAPCPSIAVTYAGCRPRSKRSTKEVDGRSIAPPPPPSSSRRRQARAAPRSPSSCTGRTDGHRPERALHSGGFRHLALAHEAVRWARDRQRELDEDADGRTDTPTRIATPPPNSSKRPRSPYRAPSLLRW